MPLGLPLNVTVALFYSGAWQDISSYVLARPSDRIVITRGLRDRQSSRLAQPAECRLLLNNTDARFTLSNRSSPLYGLIGRNTPLRVQVTTAAGTSTRFSGEVSEWPQDPIEGGAALVLSPIVASGILRRIQRRTDVGASPMARYFRTASGVLGYWSMEDGPDRPRTGDAFGGPISAASRLVVKGGICGDRDDSIVASDPLPALGTARLQATTARSAFTSTSWTVFLHCVIPESTLPATVQLLQLTTNGSGHDYYLQLNTDGTMSFIIGDQAGAALLIGGPYATVFLGAKVRFRVTTVQSGADFTYSVSYLLEGTTTGVSLTSGTIVGKLNGRPQSVVIGDGDGGDIVVGHLAVMDGNVAVTVAADEFNGYAGETASARVARLATEAGTSAFTVPAVSTVLMGAQRRAGLADLLRDVAEADGMIIDQRTSLALTWRGWASRVDPTEVTIPWTDVAPPVKPIDDDLVANDVTVTRTGGASARVEVLDGDLGVTAAGRYTSSTTVNVYRDSDTPQQAAWRAHLGTWDELRIPELTLDLVKASTATSTAVTDGSIDIGTRLVLTGLPAWITTGSLRQIADGYTETIGRYDWQLTLRSTAAGPHDLVELDDTVMGILAPDGATLAAAITTTGATSMSVSTPAGKPLWQTGSGRSIPVLLSGLELVTVTNITGAASPQTFTITRAVNGISTTHAVNATVELAYPRRLGL